MENVRRCLVAVLARGTNSWPVTEERRARRRVTINPNTNPKTRTTLTLILTLRNSRLP